LTTSWALPGAGTAVREGTVSDQSELIRHAGYCHALSLVAATALWGWTLNLALVVTLLRRWAWLVIGAAVVAGTSGYAVAAQSSPSYEASTRLLVGPIHGDLDTQRGAGQLVLTYAELVRSQAVVRATIDELDLGISPSRLADTIQTSANSATRVLTITLGSPDPERGADIVNALARNLISFATSGAVRPEGRLAVIDHATPSDTPVAPRPGVIGTFAALGGLLAAIGLAAMLQYLDNGVRTGGQLAQVAGVPLLGSMRARRRWAGLRAPEVIVDPSSEEGFNIDLLSAKIEFSFGPRAAARSIALLSVDPRGASGSWVSANLALAFASRGRQVALVDVDPAGEASLLLNRGLGLGHQVADTILSAVHVVRRPPDELEHVSATWAREVLAGILADHHVAVIHTPAAQTAPNSIVWAGAADAVVLVVRAGDPAPAVSGLAHTMNLIGMPLIGTIFVHGARVRVPVAGTASEREQVDGALPQR
jgi:capsular polysaccharide biosynthesis protein